MEGDGTRRRSGGEGEGDAQRQGSEDRFEGRRERRWEGLRGWVVMGVNENGRCGAPLRGMRGAEHHSEEAKMHYLTLHFYIRALFECLFLH